MLLMVRKWTRAMTLGELAGSPERFLALGLATLQFGTGISYSLLALYLLQHVHLSPALYGMGMSVAAFLGIVSGPVMGHLADQYDGYRLYSILMWTMSVCTAAVIFSGPWAALVLLSVLMVCGRGSATVMSVLVGRTIAAERRVRYRAVVKSMGNSTMLVGLGLGALFVSNGSKEFFQFGFAVEALMFLAASALVRLAASKATASPALPKRQRDDGNGSPVRRWRFVAFRDRRFVALTLVSSVLMLPLSLLTIALPMWVSSRMHGQLWLVPLATTISTLGVVLLQIPASRGITNVPTSVRAARRGGVLYAAAVVMLPLSAMAGDSRTAAGIVVAMAIVLVAGEVFSAAGTWGLVYGLAPESSLGQYQGMFRMGADVSMIIAPVLFSWLVNAGSLLGWAALAGVFLVAAMLLVPICRESVEVASPATV